jgi:D-alanyl-D-alanine carboxypeptidase/D-alanyl-D-alanine-endopeptidase (penicillin-binding protein 4)
MPAPRDPFAVIDSVVTTAPLDRTLWGISVIDQSTGAVLYAHNQHRHFIPASNTKLVVATVALGMLGPGWRYETPVFAVERSDSLAPALLIAARGDPTWSRRFHAAGTVPLDSIVVMASRAGLRHVGDVIIDATWFDDAAVHPTWEISDLPWAYAPPIDAFAIDEGTFRIIVSPATSPGAPAIVRASFPSAQPFTSSIVTDTAGGRTSIDADYMQRSDSVVLTGSIGLRSPPDTSDLAVISPARAAALALRRVLENAGIAVAGEVRVLRDSTAAIAYRAMHDDRIREIGRVRSVSLDSVVAAVLRPSQNWIAEQLLKTIAANIEDEGSWSAGITLERRFLIDQAGIDSTAFFLRDASGLSVQNLLTPAATVELLEFARSQAWGEQFRGALPAPGMSESTLENRLPGLEDRLRAKTGTITHVNSLAGYLETADGRTLTFSIMTNASGVASAAVRRGIDRIVEALATPRSGS